MGRINHINTIFHNPTPINMSYYCKNCGDKITSWVHEYSMKNFHTPLCINCQDTYRDSKLTGVKSRKKVFKNQSHSQFQFSR